MPSHLPGLIYVSTASTHRKGAYRVNTPRRGFFASEPMGETGNRASGPKRGRFARVSQPDKKPATLNS
jgi:hypothetical protein